MSILTSRSGKVWVFPTISRHKKELLEEYEKKTIKLWGSPADINTLACQAFSYLICLQPSHTDGRKYI